MDNQDNPTPPPNALPPPSSRQTKSTTDVGENQGQQPAAVAEVTDQLPDVEIAEQLDREIRQIVRDFVELGTKLMQMRDGQYYRHLPQNFCTFKDYCRSVQGLSISDAKRKIRASLVYQSIIGSGAQCRAPETQAQVEAVEPIAVFEDCKRPATTAGGVGRTVEQPIGIKNPDKLAAQWEATIRAFESETQKAKEKGTKPPVLSAKYVRNKLPNEFKKTVERSFDCNPVISNKNRVAQLADALEKQRFADPARIKKVMQEEPKAEAFDLDDLTRECQRLAKALDVVVNTVKEIRNGN